MSLACGGRGPCCHVGYPHRHCEHCDVVIPTHWHYYQQPWWSGTYYGNTSGQLQQISYASGQTQQLQALSAGQDHQH